MVSKILTLLLLLLFSEAYSNIVFDKNGISITDIELNNYEELYKQNYGKNLSKNKAIRDIFLMKKTLNFLLNDNPEFIKTIDQQIELEFGNGIFKNEIFTNFLRIEKLRAEFIFEYFRNNFDLKDLNLIFSKIDDLKLPISLNNCLTIEKVYQLNNNEKFIISFLENIKNNKSKFETEVDSKKYDVCINKEQYKYLETLIFKHIENKTSKNFEEFIYGKIN